ncbi:MAG: DUF3775 domain-containing protein [Gammaproteobacteria bacterium]|jgi:hypothetical protein
MLELNPETVCFLIDKAKEFHAKEEVVIPDEPLSPSEDWARQVLADHDDDLSYQEFKAAVDDLEPDQQATVVALMWLGRGDYSKDQWEDACADAKARWTPRTAEYLLARPLVANYLEEGLFQLGYSCEA